MDRKKPEVNLINHVVLGDTENAQKALIFYLMVDNSLSLDGLKLDHFSSTSRRQIFQKILELKSKGKSFNDTSLADALVDKQDKKDVFKFGDCVAMGRKPERTEEYFNRAKKEVVKAYRIFKFRKEIEQANKEKDPFYTIQDLVADYGEEKETGANLLRFDDIPEEKISWHIPGVYALGMIHSLGGVQGHGKSLHLIDLAARTSTGATWPITKEPIPKGDVLYITDEDSRDKIIKPRLRLAQADMSKVFIPDFNVENLILPDDIAKLEAWIKKMPDPKLLLLDPLADYSTGSLNASESATKIIKPLKTLADKTGICIIYTVHFNKKIDIDSIHRVAHSYVLTSKPRLAWLIIKQDADDDLNPHRLFCCGKTAFKPIANMLFTIRGDESDTPFIEDWKTAKIHTSEALASGDRRRDLKVQDAEEFLMAALENGTMFVDELKRMAETEGIKERTMYRAKVNLSFIDEDWEGKRKFWTIKKGK